MGPQTDRRRLLPPDHRAQEVQDWLGNSIASDRPEDAFEDPILAEYARYLLNDYDAVSDPVYEACVLDGIPYARMAIRAFLFVKAPIAAIVQATEVEEDTIWAYSRIFFDASVFKNRLIKMAYVRAFRPSTDTEEQLKQLFLWGLQLGWEYLAWRLTGGQTSMGTVEVMRRLMTDALWRSREHMFNPITDPRSREARAWMPIAIKLAEQINKADPDKVNSLEELKIRLEGLDTTTSKPKLGNVDILS